MKGILKSNAASKIYGEGRTYDNKLYTFKESDYRTMWNELDIWAKKLDKKRNWQNVPSARNDLIQQKANQNKVDSAIDKILDSNGFEQEIGDDFSIQKSNIMRNHGDQSPLIQQDIMPDGYSNRIIGIKSASNRGNLASFGIMSK